MTSSDQMSQRIKCLVVDDEPLARAGILELARGEPDLVVVAEARTVSEAIDMLHKHEPELVFLDIQLPDGDGLDLPSMLAKNSFPAIVVTSAYGEYALRGFDIGVEDYLMKPITAVRFSLAVERARGRVLLHRLRLAERYRGLPAISFERGESVTGEEAAASKGRLLVRVGASRRAIDLRSIDSIEAAGDYVCVAMQDSVLVCSETLKSIVAQLPPAEFMLIHRSRAVRIAAIAELAHGRNGTFIVRLRNGTTLVSSKSYRKRIIQLFRARGRLE